MIKICPNLESMTWASHFGHLDLPVYLHKDSAVVWSTIHYKVLRQCNSQEIIWSMLSWSTLSTARKGTWSLSLSLGRILSWFRALLSCLCSSMQTDVFPSICIIMISNVCDWYYVRYCFCIWVVWDVVQLLLSFACRAALQWFATQVFGACAVHRAESQRPWAQACHVANGISGWNGWMGWTRSIASIKHWVYDFTVFKFDIHKS